MKGGGYFLLINIILLKIGIELYFDNKFLMYCVFSLLNLKLNILYDLYFF